MPDPFISIIIPTYNRASFLQETIPNVLKLDYDNYEVIVVDDGSTDNTSKILNSIHSTKLRYYKKQNEERAAARNYGVAQAKGAYITFLDSDDVLYPDALKIAADALKEKNYPPFLHLRYEIGTMEKVDRVIDKVKDNDPLILVIGNPLSCMGVFVKKEAITSQKFNPDRELAGSEDWELWVRMAAHYGLRTDDRIIGRLIQHDDRSVVSSSEEKLNKRKDLAIKYAFDDKEVQRIYGSYKNTIEAHWQTYISLHLAMDGKKKSAFKYLMAGIKSDIKCFFTKRGLVIIKLLLLKKTVE